MQENRQRLMQSVGVVLALIFHVVLVCVISYGGMYISQTRTEPNLLNHKFDRLSLDHKQLKKEMRSLKQCCHQITSCKPKVWTEQPTCRSLINKIITLILHFYDQLNKEKQQNRVMSSVVLHG